MKSVLICKDRMDIEFRPEQVEVRLRKDWSIYARNSVFRRVKASKEKRTRGTWCPFVANRICHSSKDEVRVIYIVTASWRLGGDGADSRLDKTIYHKRRTAS